MENLISNLLVSGKKAKEQEQEGSLMTIENPEEKNSYEILKTEAEIKKAEKEKGNSDSESIPKDAQNKNVSRIPFGFFSHIEQNRIKYIY